MCSNRLVNNLKGLHNFHPVTEGLIRAEWLREMFSCSAKIFDLSLVKPITHAHFRYCEIKPFVILLHVAPFYPPRGWITCSLSQCKKQTGLQVEKNNKIYTSSPTLAASSKHCARTVKFWNFPTPRWGVDQNFSQLFSTRQFKATLIFRKLGQSWNARCEDHFCSPLLRLLFFLTSRVRNNLFFFS